MTISAANFDLDSFDVEDSSNDNSIVLSLDIIPPPPSLSSSSSIPSSSNKGSYFDPIINENQSDHDYITNNSDDLITTKGTIIHTVGYVSYNSNMTGADYHHERDYNIDIDDSDFDSVVYHSGYKEDDNVNDNYVLNTNNDNNNSSSSSSSSSNSCNSSRGSQVDEMIVVSSPSLSKQTTRDETDVSNKLTTISSNTQQHNTVNNIIDRITTLMLDASELRNSIVDLDDKQASTLRSVRLYIGWMKFYEMKLMIMVMMMMIMMIMIIMMVMMMMVVVMMFADGNVNDNDGDDDDDLYYIMSIRIHLYNGNYYYHYLL